MKKYVLYIAIALSAVGGYYLFTHYKSENIVQDESNFAFKEVDELDKIVLKDRSKNTVTLTKKENIWYVNGKYKASKSSMDLLLHETLNKIRIKGPVPTPARENVIRSMISYAKHVQLYIEEELIRDYYVGQPTPNQEGSYLHLNGAKVPYIGHIFGSSGVLDPKYSTDINDWYDRTVFDYKPEEIKQIQVVNNEMPAESFALTRSDSMYSIQPPIANFSQSAARSYFSLFSFKNFEGFAPYLTEAAKDSISKATPYMTIRVVLQNGKVQELNLHRKGSNEGDNTLIDARGNTVVQDTERYFATFTGFHTLVTIQEYVFGKMITRRSFFDPRYGQKP
jgi:hypothetical protein